MYHVMMIVRIHFINEQTLKSNHKRFVNIKTEVPIHTPFFSNYFTNLFVFKINSNVNMNKYLPNKFTTHT